MNHLPSNLYNMHINDDPNNLHYCYFNSEHESNFQITSQQAQANHKQCYYQTLVYHYSYILLYLQCKNNHH